MAALYPEKELSREDIAELEERGADVDHLKELINETFYTGAMDQVTIFKALADGDKDVMKFAQMRRDMCPFILTHRRDHQHQCGDNKRKRSSPELPRSLRYLSQSVQSDPARNHRRSDHTGKPFHRSV